MVIGSRRYGSEGQALPLLVGGLVGLMMVVSLIVDGGNLWSQQRIVQNGADAASEAGATVLAQRLSGNPTPAGGWDSAVSEAVSSSAGDNEIASFVGRYTDVCGQLLTSLDVPTTDVSTAAVVGSGMPPDLNTSIGCANNNPAGVAVVASKQVSTYIAGIVGIRTIPVGAGATAVSGFYQGGCGAEAGEYCNVLPVTFPVAPIVCAGNGTPTFTGATTWPMNTQVILPLCNSANGDVGWLNWSPPSGGTQQLEQSILTPNNPAITLPSWNWVPKTGEISSSQIQNALNTWKGKPVLVPLFDATCSDTPTFGQVSQPSTFGCPAGSFNQGNGVNVWYRIPQFGAFVLTQAYTNGQNSPWCNGAKECLVGEFVKLISGGVVGPGVGGGSTQTSVVGVQLLK